MPVGLPPGAPVPVRFFKAVSGLIGRRYVEERQDMRSPNPLTRVAPRIKFIPGEAPGMQSRAPHWFQKTIGILSEFA
jgi:hypothetical protein